MITVIPGQIIDEEGGFRMSWQNILKNQPTYFLDKIDFEELEEDLVDAKALLNKTKTHPNQESRIYSSLQYMLDDIVDTDSLKLQLDDMMTRVNGIQKQWDELIATEEWQDFEGWIESNRGQEASGYTIDWW